MDIASLIFCRIQLCLKIGVFIPQLLWTHAKLLHLLYDNAALERKMQSIIKYAKAVPAQLEASAVQNDDNPQ